MYLTQLQLKNVKLFDELNLSFVRNSQPRKWTVFLGENGVCKTTLLRSIALAASGHERGNQLADVRSYPDCRRTLEAQIHATFGFSDRFQKFRRFPGLKTEKPEAVWSTVWAQPGMDIFTGVSGYGSEAMISSLDHDIPEDPRWLSPLSEVRARNLPHWFVAGYGPTRNLNPPFTIREEPSDLARHRLLSLFDEPGLIGTGFADLFSNNRVQAFAKTLRTVLIDHKVLPFIKNVELRGRGGVQNSRSLIESHRFDIRVGTGDMRLPALWLSHGYKTTIAWIADLIGQIWWEADDEVALEDMEGLVLIDELGLHLHPKWQANFVRSLKSAFPNMQFIATTHSPMLLPGLEKDELITLSLNDSGNVVAQEAEAEPSLLTSDELYQRFFGVNSAMPDGLEKDLQSFAFIASNPDRSDTEDAKLKQIRDRLKKARISPTIEPVVRNPTSKKSDPST